MSIVVFWLVTPSVLVGGYQRFGGTYRLHLQGGNHIKTTRRHSREDHDIFAAVRTSNFRYVEYVIFMWTDLV
jgi:hypothetical protein